MNKFIAVLLFVTLSLSFVSANGNKEEKSVEDDQLHFVYVSPLLAHPVWLLAKDGFDQAVKELDIKGDWVGPQGVSPEEMAKLIETSIAQKVDAIITQGLVPASPVQAAIDEGIAVLVVDSPIDAEGQLAFFGKDVMVQAEAIYLDAAESLGLDTEMNVSIQVAALNYQIAVDQIEAIKTVFARHGGKFNLVNISESKSDKMKATTEWENTLKAYPEINVAICLAAESGPACASVVKDMGIKDKVKVYGVDDIEETLDLVRSGGIDGTVVTSFFNYGYQAAYWLYQNITENKTPIRKFNDAGTILVKKDNVESYDVLLKIKVDL
ncbi:MAG: substrate-binding domain-containing protein [Spirochaetaceae bacterium]